MLFLISHARLHQEALYQDDKTRFRNRISALTTPIERLYEYMPLVQAACPVLHILHLQPWHNFYGFVLEWKHDKSKGTQVMGVEHPIFRNSMKRGMTPKDVWEEWRSDSLLVSTVKWKLECPYPTKGIFAAKHFAIELPIERIKQDPSGHNAILGNADHIEVEENDELIAVNPPSTPKQQLSRTSYVLTPPPTHHRRQNSSKHKT